MFKINLTGAEETVRLSDGAGLICAPRDIDLLEEAFEDVREIAEDPSIKELAKALANIVVLRWYGLFNENGDEIGFDQKLIPAIISDPIVMQAFRDQYLNRLLYMREEGNGSSPSRNGTSGAEKTTATAAKKSARPARTARKGPKASRGATSGG